MAVPSWQPVRSPRGTLARTVLAGCAVGVFAAAIGHCQTPDEVTELLRDRRLENGVRLSDATNYPPELRPAGRERWQARLPQVADACWGFAEIAETTFFAENPNTPTFDGRRIVYASEDNSKRLEISTDTGEIRFVIDTEREWRNGCNLSLPRDGVEPELAKGQAWNWPHLLLLQQVDDPNAPGGGLGIGRYDQLEFSFSAELSAGEKGKPARCPAGSWGETVIPDHCLFYVAFKVEHQDAGATGEAAQQQAKSIYCLCPVFHSYDGETHVSPGRWFGLDPAGDGVYFTPHHTGLEIGRAAEVRIDVDELVRESVDAANERIGAGLSPHDYAVSHVLIGWEIWGAYRSDVRVSDLSFRVRRPARPATAAP